MKNKNNYYWNYKGKQLLLNLLDFNENKNEENSIKALIESLSEKIRAYENRNKEYDDSLKKDNLFNLTFSIFPNKNNYTIKQQTVDSGSFPLRLELESLIFEQETSLSDLISLLGRGQIDPLFKCLYLALLNYKPPEISELLFFGKFKDSILCIYFTMYISLIIVFYENNERILDTNIYLVQRDWFDRFIEQIDCIIEYFESASYSDFQGGKTNRDCLLLIFALIFYMIILIRGNKNENVKQNYKRITYRLLKLNVDYVLLDYWYFKILVNSIEKIGFNNINEILEVIIKYKKTITKQLYSFDYDRINYYYGISDFEIDIVIYFCKKLVNNEICIKKQLISLIFNYAIEDIEYGNNNDYECLPSNILEKIDNNHKLNPLNVIFINLIQIFSLDFGVSIKNFVINKGINKLMNEYCSTGELTLLDFLDELLISEYSNNLNNEIVFVSLRVMVCVLTNIINKDNFVNENYDSNDIFQDDIIVSPEKYNMLINNKCQDLIEKLLLIIRNLIIYYKTDQKSANGSVQTISSFSECSYLVSTTVDVTLFLLIWESYISLFSSKIIINNCKSLHKIMQLCFIYLINKKYKLDVLCLITFASNGHIDKLPIIINSKYYSVKVLLIFLWKLYIEENPSIFDTQNDELESIYTVPNINCFFEYLNMLDETIANNVNSNQFGREKIKIKKENKNEILTLELASIVSSVIISHKISNISNKNNTLMAILSASVDTKLTADYIYKQVSTSLDIDGTYIYNCLKFFRERWNTNIKIQLFSKLCDLYLLLLKPSLFQFLQCFLSNFIDEGGIFEKSFSLYKIRSMKNIILNDDYEIIQLKLTDINSYSSLNNDSPSQIKNEIFFGCYSIDLYYAINNIQKGCESPSISISQSSPMSFIKKKKHSSLILTDCDDVYALINKLNPLFGKLKNDAEYLKLFINKVGELINYYFIFIFDNNSNISENILKEKFEFFPEIFGIDLFDENILACINIRDELLKGIYNEEDFNLQNKDAVTKRFNYKFYSQIILRMIYICVWLITENNNNNYLVLSEYCVNIIFKALFGFLHMDFDYLKNDKYKYDHYLPDYYVLEHYTKYICIVWSMISSLNPESILKNYIKLFERCNLRYYQLYLFLTFIVESSRWFIIHDYFKYINLNLLLKQVELTTKLSVCNLKNENINSNILLDDASSLHINILFVYIILESTKTEKKNKKDNLKYDNTKSKSFFDGDGILKINNFPNKWKQKDAYINGGRSIINENIFLSNYLLPYIWSLYEKYPTYKDLYAKLLESRIQLTTFIYNLCFKLYDKKYWQGIIKSFNNSYTDASNELYDNTLLYYNQYIVIEYIWEYYINNNTMYFIERYISSVIYSIYSTKKINFFNCWLLLSFWKRYTSKFYRHIMKLNTTWIVNYIIDHLFHYSLIIRSKYFDNEFKQDLIVFQNMDLENLYSFLLYHFHPQHYHDRMSSKYFWYNANSEQGYLNKINSHNTELKCLLVPSKYIIDNTILIQFHDYFHYVGHMLPFSTIIYLLSNQFSSEKKKFISNSHHFHNYFHHSLYTSTLVIWSCVKSLLSLEESYWELLLLQYIEIIKSSKRNNNIILTCLLDMALINKEFSQILCIYVNNPSSHILSLLQKCLLTECDLFSAYKNKKNINDNNNNNILNKFDYKKHKYESLGVINELRAVKDNMESLTLRLSSISTIMNAHRHVYNIDKRENDDFNNSDNGDHNNNSNNNKHSLANIQFSFLYILCQLGELVKYRYKREDINFKKMEDPSLIVSRLNSREMALLKSDIACELLEMIESIINRDEYKYISFLNINMLKSSYLSKQLFSIKRVNKLKILQSAKNIPYLLSLVLNNNSNEELLVNFIVKCDDDCRQDVITMQYIHVFQKIFELYSIPVWLYPYRVLPMMFKDITGTIVYGGIIEFIDKSISLHEIHEKHPEGGLKSYFNATFKKKEEFTESDKTNGAISYEQAVYNFISSLAGYSIACYILQIKDRHNGNILVTSSGHIIHIDYGFIFDISPGNNLHFERAAFKVTQEMLDLMDDKVDLFDDLCLSGFLAVREHSDLLLSLTQLLLNSGISCFRGETIKKLKERLLLNFPQQQASNIFSKKIHSAHNHFTTKGYDLVQFIQQGIK
ncbi:hypothetical protein FG386_000984 [Cryptosporidium ryanae]|uniref:uncharacterized protein n=1 Tax=Cryptosporidium ryanae TaxID=515981 RepID=UPI00351A0405|nr:hypothetical protein FG386_000984 [Cryptosporidium ryanae]